LQFGYLIFFLLYDFLLDRLRSLFRSHSRLVFPACKMSTPVVAFSRIEDFKTTLARCHFLVEPLLNARNRGRTDLDQLAVSVVVVLSEDSETTNQVSKASYCPFRIVFLPELPDVGVIFQ